jgi:uncharacterized protein YecE (DUF72 family)
VGLQYFRLHGSPRVYFSAYTTERLQQIAQQLSNGEIDAPRWCIFDNTALGAATANALALQALIAKQNR